MQFKKEGKISVASHTQIRGSIPMKWSMKPNLMWSPTVIVDPDFKTSFAAAKKHIEDTQPEYHSQYFINLIDKKGSQGRLGEKMTDMLEKLKSFDANLHYTWFDFHSECKNMKYENLSRLVKTVTNQL